MPTPSPIYGWDLPTQSEVADGPAAFSALVNDIEATMSNKVYQTYLPSWTSATTNPANPLSRSGQYWVEHGICTFAAQIFFGPSSTGGQGQLAVGLPVPAANAILEQTLHATLWTPLQNAKWTGMAAILGQGDTTKALPYFPVNNARSDTLPWQCNGTVGYDPATGVPNVGGGLYNVQNGGNCLVFGRYFTA